ncbi:MAG: L-2-amino-thiazoline-4-carboxylic acid hydrolase [Dehalococcoidia bacterium]
MTEPETTGPGAQDEERPEGHTPEAVRATITLLQRRGIEAEVLIPLIRRMEQEIGRERAHAIARTTIEEIARDQGHAVAEALQRRDLEGFHYVKDTWSGAGGDLQIETLREDAEALEFNVTGCRFAEMYRRMGAEDLGFILSCSRDFALSEGYSDALHLERRQTIMQGAPFCDFRYRLAENRPAASAAGMPDAAEKAGATPAAGSEDGESGTERFEQQAARVGGALGRIARNLADRAKPEAERRARQARAAAEAARPHVERAAQQARDYVQTHDEQIKHAAEAGARMAADRVIPPALRPIVNAAEQELRRHEDAPPANAPRGQEPGEAPPDGASPLSPPSSTPSTPPDAHP